MDSEEYFGWCRVENTVKNRLQDNSLIYTLSSNNRIRKSTKLVNQELRKLSSIKTYSQYVKCKRKISNKVIENTDVTDESDFSDNDYKQFYNSFDVSNKERSKTDENEEGFVWFYVERTKNLQCDSNNSQDNDVPLDMLEPSIDVSIIEDNTGAFEKLTKKTNTKIVNSLADKQSKKQRKSTNKLDCSSSNKINNADSSLIKKKATPLKKDKVKNSFEIKETVNKSPKDIKRNLTSVISGVSSNITDASEGEDWNDEFISSDFQAQSTRIHSDTLSDVFRSRRSVNKLKITKNEVVNQPRDSGIEEDSREENTSINKKSSNKNSKVQSNQSIFEINEVKSGVNNDENSMKHKLPLKILGEKKLTTKYKIINKDIETVGEVKETLSFNKIKDKLKEKLEKSCESNNEYEDIQYEDNEDNESKQEIEKSSSENGKHDSVIENQNNTKTSTSPAKISNHAVMKLSSDKDKLFSDNGSDENYINYEMSINTQIDPSNVKLDRSTDYKCDTVQTVDPQTLIYQNSDLSKNCEKILGISSDEEQSREIEPQEDISESINNYKNYHLKNIKQSSNLIKSLNTDDIDSEGFEKSENEKKEENVLQEAQNQLSQEKKTELDDEESSESEDESHRNPPVKFILPDKKSETEDSEDSEMEETSDTFKFQKCDNEDEGNLSIHAEKRLAEMKRIDFANYNDSEDSDEEINIKTLVQDKKLNIKKKQSKDSSDRELDDDKSNESNESDSDENGKAVTKKNSNSLEKSLTQKPDLIKSDSSSDDEEIKLQNKNEIFDNADKQTMSLESTKRLQQLKHLTFNSDSEDSDDSFSTKVKDQNSIDIKDHKITLPEECKNLDIFELMDERKSYYSITQTKTEKASKSKKKNILIDNEAIKATQEENSANEDDQKDMDASFSKSLRQSSKLQSVNVYEESVEDCEEELNKENIKLSNDGDDDSDSDRSLSPSTTFRLSQFKKMNLIENDDSSSSSEDEDNKKNNKSPQPIESYSFKSVDSNDENAFGLKSIELSGRDGPEECTKTITESDNKAKVMTENEDESSEVINGKSQKEVFTQGSYMPSQELFSSLEDLTEGICKKSVLESNAQTIANVIPSIPKPIEIIREKVTNIPQLVNKENLLPVIYNSTITLDHLSSDEEVYLLEIPKMIFSQKLIGEQFSFSKSTLRVGNNSYEAIKRKVTPTLSCVLQSTNNDGTSYETTNIKPTLSIVTRRKKVIDDSDKSLNKEKREIKETESKLELGENEEILKSKKKKSKAKDVVDSKKVKTPKRRSLSNAKLGPEKKENSPKKKDLKISPSKAEKLENNQNPPHTISEKLKSSPKKMKNMENVDSPLVMEKEEKKCEVKSSPRKSNNKENNKFKIRQFVQKPPKIKEKKEKKVKTWNDNENLKKTLSILCDEESNFVDDKKEENIPKAETTAKELDEKQTKPTSKPKSKSEKKKVKDQATIKKTKAPKKTLAEENDDVYPAVSDPVNKPQKSELKKSKKRKSDFLSIGDPQVVQEPTQKKKKTNSTAADKPKLISKSSKAKMQKQTAEVKNTLFSLFQKTMKTDSMNWFNNSNSDRPNNKYGPLELEHTSGKKRRLDIISSSSDEDDKKTVNKSFKVRDKLKIDVGDESSNSSLDFVPNSQKDFKCKDVKRPKIFFNE